VPPLLLLQVVLPLLVPALLSVHTHSGSLAQLLTSLLAWLLLQQQVLPVQLLPKVASARHCLLRMYASTAHTLQAPHPFCNASRMHCTVSWALQDPRAT
jgi:hypothetical protein